MTVRVVVLQIALTMLPELSFAQQGKPANLEVPSILTIESPAKDCEWKALGTFKFEGNKSQVFLCTRADDKAKLLLIVEERKATDDKFRRAVLKAYWDTIVELRDKEYKDLKGKQPSLDSPIPDRVFFSAQGKNPDGDPVHIRVGVVFGKNIYVLQAMAPTPAEAERFLAAIKTLKEK